MSEGARQGGVAVEPGEQEAGVDGAGDGRVDRDRGDDRDAEHVGDVPVRERPPGLDHEDHAVEPSACAQEAAERDVARSPEQGVVIDRTVSLDEAPLGRRSVERSGGDVAGVGHLGVVRR